MNQEKIKTLIFANIELAVTFALLFAITFLNAFIFDYPLDTIAWLFIASFAADLLTKVQRGKSDRLNYLHNGDGMAAILGIIISLVLFPTGGFAIAGIFCLSALILFRTFLLLTDLSSYPGLFANIVALVACGYLIHRFGISYSSVQIIATGVFRAMAFSQWVIYAALLFIALLYIPAILLRNEIRLFSLGMDFFEEAGYRYFPSLIAMEWARCMLTAISVLGSGVFAAAGMIFIFSKRKEKMSDYATIPARIALIVQTLAVLQAVSDGTTAAIIAICAAILWSYIARRFSK